MNKKHQIKLTKKYEEFKIYRSGNISKLFRIVCL